mgnify:CR=1 FL=1|jgi:hypothetical protein|tara:strand:- start:548 stop:934 length:387 start_codon:yes stop_codon:yes gene_type:complete
MKKTKKASASKKTSSRKLDNLDQSHGKEEKFEPTTLDQIWGDEGLGKYGTLKEEEYTTEISDMSRTDIQSHAMEMGIIPVEDRESLEKRLLSEFRRHVSAYRKPVTEKKQVSEGEISEETLKVLREGR